MSLFPADVITLATDVLAQCRTRKLLIATAESCTGGLIAAALTEIAGSSDVFDCGFVIYSNDAKLKQLGISTETLKSFGSVSRETVLEMVQGAVSHSRASVCVAVTGVAGPGGGSPDKPVGLVHVAATAGNITVHRECRFGAIGREAVRLETVRASLQLMLQALGA
jgi:nicotinamide-nucleotide amidase